LLSGEAVDGDFCTTKAYLGEKVVRENEYLSAIASM
jgi:hypothetical protein